MRLIDIVGSTAERESLPAPRCHFPVIPTFRFAIAVSYIMTPQSAVHQPHWFTPLSECQKADWCLHKPIYWPPTTTILATAPTAPVFLILYLGVCLFNGHMCVPT
jgi:hypothetical protein